MSIVEILTLLYFHILKIDPKIPGKPDRDIFILSKAHGSAALYSILAEKGFFSKSLLEKYYVDEGVLPGHVDKDSVPGIEFSAGSLGHGFPVAVGMAIANNTSENKRKIYTIIGDGESNEGSVWEASMLASHLKLNNLTAIIDKNNLQQTGSNKDILNLGNLTSKLNSFGWQTYEVDGHNVDELLKVFKPLPQTLENVEVNDKNVINKSKCKNAIKKANILMGKNGRILVRKSGTEPKIRIMAESNDKSLILKCIKIIKSSINN